MQAAILAKPTSSSYHLLKMASSSLLLPSISAHPISSKTPASLCLRGFSNYGIKGCRNFNKSRVFMSVSTGSQTATVDDALFLDYNPTSAFLFPGQVFISFFLFFVMWLFVYC